MTSYWSAWACLLFILYMLFFVVLYYICKCRKPKAIEEGMFAEFWADLKIGIYPIYFILK